MITKNEVLKVLNENILNFWQTKMLDIPHNGFFGRVDGYDNIEDHADKGVVLNTRILWTFAAAYQLSGNPRHKLMADRAYEYVTKHFMDTRHGGVYWMLDHTGKVSIDKKQVYAQAFAIYAFAEYHKLNPYRRAFDHAVHLYELLEDHSFDKNENGYFEAFDREWRMLEDVRLSEKDMNATKTMNTHLHVLEAYTNLYKIWPDMKLKKKLVNLIELICTTFLYESGHFKLFFDDHWNLLSDVYSFGHDIEGSWLLLEAAEAVNDEGLIKNIQEIAIRMADAALEGLDEDGGLMYEANAEGVIDSDKHWWPQAEALVGLISAWKVTDHPKYLEKMHHVWSFIKGRIIDPQGEWRWKVSKEGKVCYEDDKAGPWKCPYHNGRAMMELYKRLPKDPF